MKSVTAVIVFVILLLRWRRKPQLCDESGTPMPRMPFWEFALRTWRTFRSTEVDLEDRLRPMQKYGDIYASPTTVVISSPDLVKQVISQNWPKVSFGGLQKSILFQHLMGESLVAVGGEKWKNQKRLVGPAFHHEQLGRLFKAVFQPVAARLVRSLRELCADGSAEWDAQEAMSQVTIDVIGLGAFGCDFGALEGRSSATRTALVEGLSLASSPVHFLLPSLFALPTASNNKLRGHLKTLDELVGDILAQKRSRGTALEGGSSDLLDLILASGEAGNGLSDRELHDNIFTFFLAGHETSAVTLTMALQKLAESQQWQSRAREEVQQVLGDTPLDQISVEALQRLEVCTAVLKETLRMYPPAAGVTPRTAPPDASLGGYKLPAGTAIQISIYALHHNENHWDRPHEFDPGRFLRLPAPHPYAWMPFSAGSRVCFGMNFAWMEMRLVLAEMLRRFEWAPKPGHKVTFGRYITLRPKDGVPLIMRRLDSEASTACA